MILDNIRIVHNRSVTLAQGEIRRVRQAWAPNTIGISLVTFLGIWSGLLSAMMVRSAEAFTYHNKPPPMPGEAILTEITQATVRSSADFRHLLL